MNKEKLDSIRQALSSEPDMVETRLKNALSSGSTLLNLACTGDPFLAYMRGGFYLFVGDSSAGKTVFASMALAEAAINPLYAKYALKFDNVEDGALMFEKFYGHEIAERIKSPITVKGVPVNSRTVEEFYYHHHKSLEENTRHVYALDSETSLTSEAEEKKQGAKRKAIEDSEETAGTMTDGKAKAHSQNLRVAISELREHRSILIMLCQTRDAMGFGAKFEPKTRAGGRALKFYAQLELWFSVVGKLSKTVRGEARQIGVIARIKVKKNRITGKERSVDIPIYHSTGVDDVGSCIDYLVSEQHWDKAKEKKGLITAPEFSKVPLAREALVQLIESQNKEDQLRRIVGNVWNDIERKCQVERKNKYIQA